MNVQYILKTKSAYEAAAFSQVLAKASVLPQGIEGDGHKNLWWYVWETDLGALYGAAQELLGKSTYPNGLLSVAADLGAKVQHSATVGSR